MLDQCQKVLCAKVSATLTNTNKWIFRINTGIAARNRFQLAMRIVVINTIRSPIKAPINQFKFLLIERVERMDYTKCLC